MTLELRDRQFDYGPQRASWTFHVPLRDLLAAATVRLELHQNRLAYWKVELVNATAQVKQSLSVREHAVTGGTQFIAVVDQERGSYKATCEAKIRDHEREVEYFGEWVGLFTYADLQAILLCTIEDALYFGLSTVAK